MELRKEFQDIAARVSYEYEKERINAIAAIGRVALACQELADRPPRELTDAEISEAHESVQAVKSNSGNINPYWLKGVRAIIAAHTAKQREPQVVKFRAAMNKESGAIEMLRDGNSLPTAWCFLEPAQEFEVRI